MALSNGIDHYQVRRDRSSKNPKDRENEIMCSPKTPDGVLTNPMVLFKFRKNSKMADGFIHSQKSATFKTIERRSLFPIFPRATAGSPHFIFFVRIANICENS